MDGRQVALVPTEMARGRISASLQEWSLMVGRLEFREEWPGFLSEEQTRIVNTNGHVCSWLVLPVTCWTLLTRPWDFSKKCIAGQEVCRAIWFPWSYENYFEIPSLYRDSREIGAISENGATLGEDFERRGLSGHSQAVPSKGIGLRHPCTAANAFQTFGKNSPGMGMGFQSLTMAVLEQRDYTSLPSWMIFW